MLDALVFEHARNVSVPVWSCAALEDPLVELVYEGRLDDLGLLCGSGSANGGRRAAIAVGRVSVRVAVC